MFGICCFGLVIEGWETGRRITGNANNAKHPPNTTFLGSTVTAAKLTLPPKHRKEQFCRFGPEGLEVSEQFQ